MSATGDEVVTLSQLKEVYNSIVDKLPSAVTFTSAANTSQYTPSDKPINISSVSGDTSLARLSGNTIFILKQANYSLSGNVRLTGSSSQDMAYGLFIQIGYNNPYRITRTVGASHEISGPISFELGVLNPNTTIRFYFGFWDGTQAPYGFQLIDSGSMFTLKTS